METEVFGMLNSLSIWGTRIGVIPSYITGVVGWLWLRVVVATILVGLKISKP